MERTLKQGTAHDIDYLAKSASVVLGMSLSAQTAFLLDRENQDPQSVPDCSFLRWPKFE